MAIKPILFNTEMVRAILDGRKTCTRLVVKTRRKDACGFFVTRKTDGTFAGIYEYDENESMFDNKLKPPYQSGDILYIRETWGEGYAEGTYIYKADDKLAELPTFKETSKILYHPSIHMPKEAARIWLKVTDVRVERLQEMTLKDFKAEGIYDDYKTYSETYTDHLRQMAYQKVFARLWNSTIKKSDLDRYGWEANPYVFVIEFERCEKPEEERR